MANLGRAIAGLGAVAAGYARGNQMYVNNERIKAIAEREAKRAEYEDEKIQDEREERADRKAAKSDARDAWEPIEEPGSIGDVALRNAKPSDMMQTTIPPQGEPGLSLASAKPVAQAPMSVAPEAVALKSAAPTAVNLASADAPSMAAAAPSKRLPLPHEAYAKQARAALQRGDTANGIKLMDLAKSERVKYVQETIDEARRKGGWKGIIDAANANDGIPNNKLEVVDVDGGFELRDTGPDGQVKTLQRFDNRNGDKDTQLYTFAGVQLGVTPFRDYDTAIAAQNKANKTEDRQVAKDNLETQLKQLQIDNEKIKNDYEKNPEVQKSKLEENALKIKKLKAEIANEGRKNTGKAASDDTLDFKESEAQAKMVSSNAQKVAGFLASRGMNIKRDTSTDPEKPGDYIISPALLSQVEKLTMNGISQSEIVRVLGDRDERGNPKALGMYNGKKVLKTSKGLLPIDD